MPSAAKRLIWDGDMSQLNHYGQPDAIDRKVREITAEGE